MEITFKKSGGLAGVHERLGPVDTAQQGDAGGEIEAKVEQIGFFAMPERLPEEGPVYDGFGYGVTVADAERRHQVEYSDSSRSDDRRPLDELAQLLEANGWAYREVPLEAEPSS